MKSFLKRLQSIGLAVAILFGSMVSMYASGGVVVPEAATVKTSNTLDGWTVDVVWGNKTHDFTWNATTASTQDVKMIVTYSVNDAPRHYAAGDISFQIRGIGFIDNAIVLKPRDLFADRPESEWSYTYDGKTDTYTFKNKFVVSVGGSQAGGFEIGYSLSANSCRNGFSQTTNPKFSISGQGEIALPALSINFTSQRDAHVLSMTRSLLNANDWAREEIAYIWYDLEIKITVNKHTRNALYGKVTLSFDLPEGMSSADFVFKNARSNRLYSVVQKGNICQLDVSDFSLCSDYSTDVITMVRMGVKRSVADGKQFTVNAHLSRRFDGESDWVDSAGSEDVVDASLQWQIQYYEFFSEGWLYWQNHYTTLRGYSPSSYNQYFNSIGLYDHTIVPFRTYGRVMGHFVEASSISNESGIEVISSDDVPFGEMVEPLPSLDKLPTYDEVVESEPMPMDFDLEPFDMVLGNDTYLIRLKSGSLRRLANNEYDISYIVVPKTEQVMTYEVYGATTQDASFGLYKRLAIGNTGETKTCSLNGAGVKAIFLRVKNVTTEYECNMDVGVELHLDRNAISALPEAQRVDNEGVLSSLSYFRAMVAGERDNVDLPDNYADTSFNGLLEDRDRSVFGSLVWRYGYDVYLRIPTTVVTPSLSFTEFSGSNPYWHTTLNGSIDMSSDADVLKKFSYYVVFPEALYLSDDSIKYSSVVGTYTDGGSLSVSDVIDHVVVSETYVNNQYALAFNFDFSERPLVGTSQVRIQISLPLTLSRTNYFLYGSQYNAATYLLLQDNSSEKVTLNNGAASDYGASVGLDSFDIDRDRNRAEYLVRVDTSTTISLPTFEWREACNKSVKTAYYTNYVKESLIKLYEDNLSAEDKKFTEYEYKLEYEIGSNAAANVVFYDNIEQGAQLSSGTVQSDWQGDFLGVDASYIEQLGAKAIYWYSTNPKQAFGLAQPGWQRVPSNSWANVDKTKVKSVAIQIDTSNLPEGRLTQSKGYVYATIKMRAPSNRSYLYKKAVNQYTVQYDGYSLTGESLGKAYSLTSDATTLTLRSSFAQVTLYKRDADNVVSSMGGGSVLEYAPLTEGKFMVYNSDRQPLWDEAQTPDQYGKLPVLNDVEWGTYYWSELEAPRGYVLESGLHAFTVNSSSVSVDILNHRVKGEVTLTKIDENDPEDNYMPPYGAYYELWTKGGQQVVTNKSYEYVAPMDAGSDVVDRFMTDDQGQIHITGLPWGTYVFREVEAPLGYELNSKEVSFSVGRADYSAATGKIAVSVTHSEWQTKSTIRLIKKDAVDGSRISGAMFDFYRYDNTDERIYQNLRTNGAGEIEVSGLRWGTYYFRETVNAPGYKMPSVVRTDLVTITPAQAGNTFEVEFTNERQKGSVEFSKVDDFGQYVAGAEYTLYYKADTASVSSPYQRLSTYTTSDDGTFSVGDLDWGSYYFVETKAPKGYELSSDHLDFVVNRDNVESVIPIRAEDHRQRGTVCLTKVDAETSTPLAGARFDLYSSSGVKQVYRTDYTLSSGSSIVTDSHGQVTISGLKQGGYYLLETTAPTGYTISDEPIRFSVTLANASTVQNITAENEKSKATITVYKDIIGVTEPSGKPSFIFTVRNMTTQKAYAKVMTLDKNTQSGNLTFVVDRGYRYQITEAQSLRYQLNEIYDIGSNVTHSGTSYATADLRTEDHAEVAFENKLISYDKFGDSEIVLNSIKTCRKPTSLSVDYTGLNPLSDSNVKKGSGYITGYNPDDQTYTFQPGDMVITVNYDDGTSAIVPFKDCVLSPASVHGGSGDTSATINVSYYDKMSGITAKGSFQIDIELSYTPRYTIVVDCGKGTIVPDSGWSSNTTSAVSKLYKYNVKSGTSITLPTKEPKRTNYVFMGWALDGEKSVRWNEGNRVSITDDLATSKETIHIVALWQEPYTIKYAVRLYGIEHDGYRIAGMTSGVSTHYNSLTFGPAGGADYRHSYVSHTPSVGKMCLHDMDWEDIYQQAQIDPYVFSECLQHGCTHSVALDMANGVRGMEQKSYAGQMDDGDGVGTLYATLAYPLGIYRPYDEDIDYRNSVLRNTLVGTNSNVCDIENCSNSNLIGYFWSGDFTSNPLLDAISPVLSNCLSGKDIYATKEALNQNNELDYIWAFSLLEMCGPDNRYGGADTYYPTSVQGTVYESQQYFTGSKNIFYDEDGIARPVWSRQRSDVVLLQGEDASKYHGAFPASVLLDPWSNLSPMTKCGISFGFCLY